MNSQRIYDALIERAKNRSLPTEAYWEEHHIVPRGMGGMDVASNRVLLLAKEHFLAHWLLYRIHKNAATSRAFKLMVQDRGLRRGADYADARQKMSDAMRGDKNVAKRPEVRAKLKEKAHAPFAGKKRPEHAALMSEKGHWAGTSNPFFGKGDTQRGASNHYAVAVRGVHPVHGERLFATLTEAGEFLGVTYQAVYQAEKKKQKTKGWTMERVT